MPGEPSPGYPDTYGRPKDASPHGHDLRRVVPPEAVAPPVMGVLHFFGQESFKAQLLRHLLHGLDDCEVPSSGLV